MFCETLVNVDEKSLNSALVFFLCFISQSRHTQLIIIDQYLLHVIVASFCALAKPRGVFSDKLSNLFVVTI